jgi:predicted transcriptional regulator
VNRERVAQCLRRGAITCNEETTLHFVAQIMVVNRIRYCVVMNNKREIVGLISSDAMINAFGKDFAATRAKDILTRDGIATVTLSTPLKDAVAVMAKEGIEHLIVVSDKAERTAVIGMLFASDVIALMAKGREQGMAS